MMSRETRDIRPVLLKFGVAVALSLGGILYSFLRAKRIKRSQSPLPASPSSDRGKAEIKNEPQASRTATSETHEESCLHKHKVPPDGSVACLSPSSGDGADKDGILLPEFNDLVKEFNMGDTKAGLSPKKNVEMPSSDVETPRALEPAYPEECEQEIRNLKNLVKVLREKERSHEIKLLEYYGLKEQETAVMEFQNRLKINNIEAKLFTLKIEALHRDNRRLEAQVADYVKVVAELEAARTKIKMLKKKLKFETEQTKEQILTLQQRVRQLQNQEREAVANNWNVQVKLQQLKDLQKEAAELRCSNYSLQVENSNLSQRLESTQILAHAVLEDKEAEAMKVEVHHLRRQNEDLLKEIEQLQADRSSDVEELVYLRWINACLRYELRNFQPGPGKTIARDLSKTLSPSSQQKAKQLIVEYANREGWTGKEMNVTDSDFDQWSSSSHSYVTDSGEYDDSSLDNSSSRKTENAHTLKSKILSKLRRLMRRKGSHRSQSSSQGRTATEEYMMANSSNGQGNLLRSTSVDSCTCSVQLDSTANLTEDVKDPRGSSRNSDIGQLSVYSAGNLQPKNQLHGSPVTFQKSQVVKYAEALNDSDILYI
ncbi:protein CHUP1, chloroplastic isoform X2 [Diospyros lotus]|uniref:protein CHUP1, chloroplastic isoform X2 n=1 Tax=Diospyros lotus TaxID=55363 RepID=UPI00224FFDDD|nr:protein CHUP1, chloroplastic isoform X2 [Diospyros lotus]